MKRNLEFTSSGSADNERKAQYDSQVEGDIPLELRTGDKNSQEPLSLYLGMTTCGITYESCPVHQRRYLTYTAVAGL